jgi:2-polyprenyl-6-methoxyphenol hydroxylase-like FAD-dependent oxidoreductase
MTETISTDVCVVGGGPAGLTFALALAARGHDVVVLEKNQSFERSFRGESIAPDSVSLLDQLGILEPLRDQSILEVRAMELQDAGKPVLRVDFGRLTQPVRLPIEVPQPMLLRALTRVADQHPGFTLLRQTSATDLITDRRGVTGVRARTAHGPIEVRARLTVGADGRYSKVRDWAGLEYRKIPLSRDFLWFIVPCPSAWTNDAYRVRISGAQHAMCIPTHPDLVRVGFNIPKNGLRQLRAQGIEALHARIDDLAPELSEGVRQQVVSWSNTAMLEIFTSVVPRWSIPGLVLIGDAAHTLSPVLAQGINHAIIDGAGLAAMVSHALTSSRPDDNLTTATAGFQRLRAPAVDRARALQLRQEKLFAAATPPAQALRRALYRVVDRTPALKRRIWTGLYQTSSTGPVPRRPAPDGHPAPRT